MKFLAVLLIVAFATVQAKRNVEKIRHFVIVRNGLPPPPAPDSVSATPQWNWILQRLDNFDSRNTNTWYMRYITNDQYFKPGGPIFIMLGAEWTINPGWLQGGQMYDMARQHDAMMYYTEHRYYGNSKPTSDLSSANMKYLTTPQALADVAEFIKYVKNSSPDLANSKVVVFGGSYGGNMAIWMREKYPDLVHAALSSSAPVLAKVDFKEYFEVVQSALSDPRCYGVIKNGIDAVKILLATGPIGIEKIMKDFNVCYPIDTDDIYDTAYFFNSIANEFAGIIQYATGNDLSDTCYKLMNPPSADDYTRLATFVRNKRYGCVGNYKDFVDYFSNVNLKGDSRQWIFQTCNEYGYFQTSDSENQPFGHTFPLDMNYQMCVDIYGPEFTEKRVNKAVAETNARYGGLNPAITRVISVHGTGDPWHALGLSQDVNEHSPVIVVPGTSHCADMQSVSYYDSPELREAKLREQQLITQWLAEP